ncbi:MAG: hypothetical protein PHH47_00755 [Gallionella sp.]|nr:hypothetical protein [Gallionella sp.]MDD4946846.1 hypothetical protein [Gallionella sp.]
MAEQGFFAAHGCIAAQGFFAAQGLALWCLCLAIQGCLPAQGFFPAHGLAEDSFCERPAHGFIAPQGAAIAAPLIAAANAPVEIRVFAILLNFIFFSKDKFVSSFDITKMVDARISRGEIANLTRILKKYL